MSNNFYTRTFDVLNGSRVGSQAIEDQYELVEQGFDAAETQVSLAIRQLGNYGVDSGSANAYVVTGVATNYITSYVDGLTLRVKTVNANTGASTINVNSLGAKSIKRPDGTLLQADDILANAPFEITYVSALAAFVLKVSTAVGTAGADGTSGLEPYSERANTATTLIQSDASKKIKITGAGGTVQAIDSYLNLTSGWRTKYWNGTTGLITITTDGVTYAMMPGEVRELYVDLVNNRIGSTVIAGGRYVYSASATWTKSPGYVAFDVRAQGAGSGGAGGGGGGSGDSNGDLDSGAGGSGGAGGSSGVLARAVIAAALLPATVAIAVGAGGTAGASGPGGAGTSGTASGTAGSDGGAPGAGGDTTFGTAADLYYVQGTGGAATGVGVGKGGAGAGGPSGGAAAGGAAASNTSTPATDSSPQGVLKFKHAIGGNSSAAATTTSASGENGLAGTNGGAGSTSGANLTAVAGGVAGAAKTVDGVGNAGAAPLSAGGVGQGGAGGGGGSGSKGHATASSAGGAGSAGAAGGPGQLEIIGIH